MNATTTTQPDSFGPDLVSGRPDGNSMNGTIDLQTWRVVAGPFSDTKGNKTWRAVNGSRVCEVTTEVPTDLDFDSSFAFAVQKAKSGGKL